jgi:hypothetical protein
MKYFERYKQHPVKELNLTLWIQGIGLHYVYNFKIDLTKLSWTKRIAKYVNAITY